MDNYTINEAKKAIKSGVSGYLAKDEKGKYLMKEVHRIPFYLEGNPGIGKTQAVEQVANELGIGFVSFSITHHSRNTVLGLPVISEVDGVKYTEYTMSEIIAKVIEKYNDGEKEGILLLDEFNCMSETIMPVMLSFLQTKNIGMHTLPEGWVIVLCGNPIAYNKSARKFDYAIMDRLRKLTIDFSKDDFYTYADEHGFEKMIRSFLRMNPECVYSANEVVTCRSWENLDIAIKMLSYTGDEPDEKMIRQFIKSDAISKKFYRFYKMQQDEWLTEEELRKLLDGDGVVSYSRVLEKMSFSKRAEILDTLIKITGSDYRDKKISAPKCRDYIDRIIALYKKLDDKNCLEKAFNLINADKSLMTVLSKIKSEEYVGLVQMIYYNKKAV